MKRLEWKIKQAKLKWKKLSGKILDLLIIIWTDSEGAIWEFLIAKKVLGIPVFFSIESIKEVI